MMHPKFFVTVTLFSPSLLPLPPLSLPVLILFFPLLFAWGLLPQADTFVIYLAEQIDMHIFGGTGHTLTQHSLYSLMMIGGRCFKSLSISFCAKESYRYRHL